MRKPSPTAERVFSSFSQTAQARRLGFSMLLIFASALACQAQVVSQRTRLGNATEDITFVSSGRFANHIAIVDGFDVLGVPLEGCLICTKGTLFDVRALGTKIAPRGITFIESEALLALNDPLQPTTLFLTDDEGHPVSPRTIKYLGGFVPRHVEGLAYIPTTSAFFPDHLIEVARTSPPVDSRLEILRRDGQVVAEIISAQSLRSSFLVGVTFKAPDRILVSTDENAIWTLDFAGSIVAGPTLLPGVEDIEGLTQLPDGRILAAAYDAGTLFFFDETLSRLPEQDIDYTIGVGISLLRGVAWNSDTNEYLIVHAGFRPQTTDVVSIPQSLDAATQIVNLEAREFFLAGQATFMSDEHLIAIAHSGSPSAILLFDMDGTLVQQIGISAALGNPRAITYIPTTRQFAAIFGSQPQMLRILSRNGELVRTIDLSLTGIGPLSTLAFFNPDDPSGGQFLMFEGTATNRAVVADFSGNVLSEFNYLDKLGVASVIAAARITSGPDAGSFGIINSFLDEIVIFSLD